MMITKFKKVIVEKNEINEDLKSNFLLIKKIINKISNKIEKKSKIYTLVEMEDQQVTHSI